MIFHLESSQVAQWAAHYEEKERFKFDEYPQTLGARYPKPHNAGNDVAAILLCFIQLRVDQQDYLLEPVFTTPYHDRFAVGESRLQKRRTGFEFGLRPAKPMAKREMLWWEPLSMKTDELVKSYE
jgi:hypothetical protein